jgi:predicted transcriptional regulator
MDLLQTERGLTEIVYKTSLNFTIVRPNLKFLLEKGLIIMNAHEKYEITETDIPKPGELLNCEKLRNAGWELLRKLNLNAYKGKFCQSKACQTVGNDVFPCDEPKFKLQCGKQKGDIEQVILDRDDWSLICDAIEIACSSEVLKHNDRFAGMQKIMIELVKQIENQSDCAEHVWG